MKTLKYGFSYLLCVFLVVGCFADGDGGSSLSKGGSKKKTFTTDDVDSLNQSDVSDASNDNIDQAVDDSDQATSDDQTADDTQVSDTDNSTNSDDNQDVADQDNDQNNNDDSDTVGDDVADQTTDSVDSDDRVTFVFDHKSGKCVNSIGVEGRNLNEFVNCGDMSKQTIDGENFKKRNIYGISLEDTFVTNSKVKVNWLVEYEALINMGTQIDGMNNLVDKMFKGHANAYNNSVKSIKKKQEKFDKIKSQMAELLEQYEQADTEKKQKKIERKIASKQKQLNKQKKQIDKNLDKRLRHQAHSKKYGSME